MAKKISALALFFFLLIPVVPFQINSTQDLPPNYKKWLEEDVIYIISEIEKDVFLQLDSDRERDLFIEAFWKQRDPTPGTPENEFKTEHYRRLAYANSHLGRGVPKPGWKTHRGEVYIILGEPIDIQRYSGENAVYDTEIWFYQGLTKYGLPPAFNLVFFQKEGVGDHILYSPISHGPQALMHSFQGNQANYQAAYRQLKEIDPLLAQTSVSLIPGEPVRFTQPSLASDMLIQKVYSAPQKQIKDIYAEKFLAYKDIVEVDYTANYIDSDSSVKIIQDSSGIYFVHYVIQLTKFSMQQYENKYSTHFTLNGSVSDQEGNMVYQYDGSFTVDLDELKLKNVANRPFNLYDMIPLLPGSYNLSVILKNEVSKEFSAFERKILIPEESGDSIVTMGQLILGYKSDRISSEVLNLAPFRLGLDQIYHQPTMIFHPQEKLIIAFQMKGLSPGLSEMEKIKFEFFRDEELFFKESSAISDIRIDLNFKEVFLLRNFVPDHYKVKVSLWDGDREIISQWEEFDVTSVSTMPRPWSYNRELPPVNNPSYAFILGKQYLNKKEFDQARIKLEEAYNKNPKVKDFAEELARLYLIQKNSQKAKEILEPFSETDETSYQIYFLLGQSYFSLGEYAQALNICNKAISFFGANTQLLNIIGDCHLGLGNNSEAQAAWDASLKANPEQPEIIRKLEAVKK